MKKIFYLVFLVCLAPYSILGSFASSSSFHQSLPENKREEITIVNEHSVRVGLGPDQRSVSCNILDAIGSIPSINGNAEPDVVYVNKEKVHHIREGLYTWDRAGKYRVRLTTKYIREFGEITVRIPPLVTPTANSEEAGFAIEETLSYYESLPENKKEEITIIDAFMVEVGLGFDLKSIQSNIQDAVKSIPSVRGETFPEFVNVNENPIFYIGNGLYSWDSEGSNPVRLTTAYIKKFGNIRVSIPNPSSSIPEKINLEEPQVTKNERPLEPQSEITPIEESVTKAPAAPQGTKTENPIPPPPPQKIKGPGLKGFRLAHFGMDISAVIKAIEVDLEIERSQINITDDKITISTDKLSEQKDMAFIQYFFSPKNKGLEQVDVLWEASGNTDSLARRFVQLFSTVRFLESQPLSPNEPLLYFGMGPNGNTIKLSWADDAKPLSSQRPLLLSYIRTSH